MGCSCSRLEDNDAVHLCKDRRRYIKQAVEHRIQLAATHVAYIQSLRRVSNALRRYVEGDEHREFLSIGQHSMHSFIPSKKGEGDPEIVAVPLKSLPSGMSIQSHIESSQVVNRYMRSSTNPSIFVQERPTSPETIRIESNFPMHHHGMDGFLSSMPPPYTISSPYFSSSPYNMPNNPLPYTMSSSNLFSPPCDRPSIPPPSPQSSQWDYFWNPFSSLDTYGYPNKNSIDHSITIDEMMRLRQVREEEGIPDLEEEEVEEFGGMETIGGRGKVDLNWANERVVVEDDNEVSTYQSDTDCEHEEFQSQIEDFEAAAERNEIEINIDKKGQEMVCERDTATDDTPAFTVYVDHRPMNMVEVIKDLEDQFSLICDSAKQVASLLESSRAQHSSNTIDLTAIKMLNPFALIRSASSRSTSSRFLFAPPVCKDYSNESDNENENDFFEESCMFSGSHQSSLDRVYAWEKKLYEEVKSGERIRLAYDKKCKHLRNLDMKGEDSSIVDKTRASVRDLHTQINVSIQTVRSISKRIEALRDEELQPQLMELMQGFAKMWRVMANCHGYQKQTIDKAKRLLAHISPKILDASVSIDLFRLSCSALNLQSELRNWRACFDSWMASQRSYIRALTNWALRCVRSDAGRYSPQRSDGSLPILDICMQWSRLLDTLRVNLVVEDLDFFVAGIGSVFGQEGDEEEHMFRKRLLKTKSYGGVGFSTDMDGKMALIEREEDDLIKKKVLDLANKVLCAGMSVVVNSLEEFATGIANGYEEMVKQWEQNPGEDNDKMKNEEEDVRA